MSGTQLVTYQQQWDIDNHLVVVTNTTTGQVTRYFYDADGNRVKRIGPQGTTVYVNADYEVTGPSQMVTPTVTIPPTYTHKLYFAIVASAGGVYTPLVNLAPARVTYRFNGQQVAVREDVTLTFVYGDHLGSASLTADASGAKVSEVRYYPYGEVRFSSGSLPSERTFTGQRAENVGTVGNLMDYGARFYAPTLGRFISPDTIIPKPSDPQSINRYTYVLNRPLTGNDPDGHCFPVCTALIGAAIGAIVGGGSYMIAMAVSGQEIRADHALLAAGAGALAGGLIGTGIGIAAVAPAGMTAAAATTLGATLVGGGIGAGAAGEGYIMLRPVEKRMGGSGEFKPSEFTANVTTGLVDGMISSRVGPIGRLASGTLIGGTGTLALTDALEGKLSSTREYLVATGIGLLSSSLAFATQKHIPQIYAHDSNAPYTFDARSRWLDKAQQGWENASRYMNWWNPVGEYARGAAVSSVTNWFQGWISKFTTP
jgi:RHS repeat-associated protein